MKYTIELIEKIAELKGLQLSKTFEATNYTLPHESVEILLDRQLIKKIDLINPAPEEEAEEEAVAASVVLEEPILEEAPVEELAPQEPLSEVPVQEEPTVEIAPVEAASVAEESTPIPSSITTTIEETPTEEIQNAELIEAESIHVGFLQKICKQFDADELNAHVKVVYKKQKEKKTSIFDIVMKKNRS